MGGLEEAGILEGGHNGAGGPAIPDGGGPASVLGPGILLEPNAIELPGRFMEGGGGGGGGAPKSPNPRCCPPSGGKRPLGLGDSGSYSV